jgi:hypothetical protein
MDGAEFGRDVTAMARSGGRPEFGKMVRIALSDPNREVWRYGDSRFLCGAQ